MVADTLKGMLNRAATSENMDRLPARLAALINTYDGASVHPQFRLDMFKMLESAIDLASLMAEPEYDAVAAQRHGFAIISLIPGFIKQAENSQMAKTAYAIQNKANRATLAYVFSTEEEAKIHLNGLTVAGIDTSIFEVIPIRVSLMTGAPPLQIAPPKIPTTSPFPPVNPPSALKQAMENVDKNPPFEQAPLTTTKPVDQ